MLPKPSGMGIQRAIVWYEKDVQVPPLPDQETSESFARVA